MNDTRIPYGSRCTWWDSIDKVGLTPASTSGHRLPCCPVCRCMLFEVESEEVWWAGAQKYEDNGHPGYVDMMRWARGQCFPNMVALEHAYARRPEAKPTIVYTDTPRPPTKRQRRRHRGKRST